MASNSNNLKDTALLLLLGALLFFGALFLFASFNQSGSSESSSLKDSEKDLDRRINTRISAIEAKIKFKKSKRLKGKGAVIDSVDQSSLVPSELDLFKTEGADKTEAGGILDETIKMVETADESEEERRAYVQSYKKEYIRRARLDGWDVKLNDDLEVISAVKIKAKKD